MDNQTGSEGQKGFGFVEVSGEFCRVAFMSNGANININDASNLIRNSGFVAAFTISWLDANGINGMPNIDADRRKFDSLESHSHALRFLVDDERKNAALFRPKVSEMWFGDFAVKLIKKICDRSNSVLLFVLIHGTIPPIHVTIFAVVYGIFFALKQKTTLTLLLVNAALSFSSESLATFFALTYNHQGFFEWMWWHSLITSSAGVGGNGTHKGCSKRLSLKL